MTVPRTFNRAIRILPAAACGAGAIFATEAAHADTYFTASVASGLRASTSPYTGAPGTPGGVAVSLDIQPRLTIKQSSSEIDIAASGSLNQYIKNYGSDYRFGGSIAASKRVSSQVSLNANASYGVSRSSYGGRIFAGDRLAQTQPIFQELLIDDPSLLGNRSRIKSLNAGAGFSYRPSERDSLSLNAEFAQTRTADIASSNYRSLQVQGGYSRVVSASTSLRASVSVSKSTYRNSAAGNGSVVSPQLGADIRLSEKLNLSVMAGVSISRTDLGNGVKVTSHSLSGNARLCSHSSRDSYCFSGSIGRQPTAFNGLTSVTRITFDASRKLSSRSSLSGTVSYHKSSDSGLVGRNFSTSYLIASASLSRQFNQRIYGFVSPSVEKALNFPTPRKTNYAINIGVRFVLGDQR